MSNFAKKTIKATILNVIVALLSSLIILITIYLIFSNKIENTISLINLISVDISSKNEILTTIDENNKIKNYPEYGKQYGNIKIPKIEIYLPVYYGDTLEILKNGVGHSSGSYFPGEGGSIIYMGHNSKKYFRRFSELEKNDEITIKTSYGEYKYKIFDMQIVQEKELEKLPIQHEKEILMLYTCYPFNNIGYTTKRYVVYAELKK